MGLVRQIEGQVRFAKQRGGIFYLLGLMHGHWDAPMPATDMIVMDDVRGEMVNMGMGLVVPVTKSWTLSAARRNLR